MSTSTEIQSALYPKQYSELYHKKSEEIFTAVRAYLSKQSLESAAQISAYQITIIAENLSILMQNKDKALAFIQSYEQQGKLSGQNFDKLYLDCNVKLPRNCQYPDLWRYLASDK